MTYSVFEYLTTLSSEEPPTKLIQTLILLIGHHVCSVRRNMQTWYHLVSRVHDIANAVNALINKVNEESWDNFDKYTKAIGPLEGLLVKITELVETESTSLLLTRVDSICHCQGLIESWHTNRSLLRTYFDELDSEFHINVHAIADICPAADTEQDDRTRAQIHDDNYLLSAFCDAITNHPLIDSRSYETWIEQGKKLTKVMNSKLLVHNNFPNDLMALGIMCAMLMYGTMEIATHSNDDVEKSHLRSSDVWTNVRSLLSQVVSHMEHKSPSFDELQAKYDELLVVLEGVLVELVSALLEMRECASRIRRPYFEQSVTLISQCRALVDYFNQHKTPRNVPQLISAMKEAKKALRAAADAVTSIQIQTIDVENIHASANEIFGDAEEKIKSCFDHYQLTSWDSYADKMAKALETDKIHFKRLNDRLRSSDR